MATHYSSYPAWHRSNRAQDWANLILAIWLFISPWVLQFGAGPASASAGAAAAPLAEVSRAAWNAWVLGVIVFLVALSALGRMEAWQEYINMVLGAWIFIAPWVLGFTPLGRASWDHWIVGALVFLIALWSLSAVRDRSVASTGVPPVNPPRNPPVR
jgi:hypothetical protein